MPSLHCRYAEQITIKYASEDVPATLRADHAVDIGNRLHMLLETVTGYFFVAILTNAEVQRPTFWYISAQSKFHDARIKMPTRLCATAMPIVPGLLNTQRA